MPNANFDRGLAEKRAPLLYSPDAERRALTAFALMGIVVESITMTDLVAGEGGTVTLVATNGKVRSEITYNYTLREMVSIGDFQVVLLRYLVGKTLVNLSKELFPVMELSPVAVENEEPAVPEAKEPADANG